MNIKRPKSIQKVLSFVITKQLTKPSKRQEEEKMTLSIVVQLVLLNSIVQFPTASSKCETNIVSNNIHNNARKFHLRDSRSNQYLIVESDTMLLRTVSSAEFEHFQQNKITWFTDSLLTAERIWFKCDLPLQFIPSINVWKFCIDLRPFSRYSNEPFSRTLRSPSSNNLEFQNDENS